MTEIRSVTVQTIIMLILRFIVILYRTCRSVLNDKNSLHVCTANTQLAASLQNMVQGSP